MNGFQNDKIIIHMVQFSKFKGKRKTERERAAKTNSINNI